MHDDAEYEMTGNIFNIRHFIKADHDPTEMSNETRQPFEDMPNECVILGC